jgi:hypothetical protein
MNPENILNSNEEGLQEKETPEQREMSEKLQKMAKDSEDNSRREELEKFSGEAIRPESFLEQKSDDSLRYIIERLRNEKDHPITYGESGGELGQAAVEKDELAHSCSELNMEQLTRTLERIDEDIKKDKEAAELKSNDNDIVSDMIRRTGMRRLLLSKLVIEERIEKNKRGK